LDFALELNEDHGVERRLCANRKSEWRAEKFAMVQQESSLGDDYVLGHSAEEYERLRNQAQKLEPATKRIFESIGLRAGSSCLDVGCGPGEVMRLMGEIVGPSGRVTGLDRDTRAGREAISRLQASGTSQYRLIEADIETIRDVDSESFDLTFARLALIFARDPVSLLRKMYSWTRPGGYIVIQDFYMRTVNIYPKLEAFLELSGIMVRTFERAGQDVEFALKLPTYFVQAGVGTPDGTDMHLPLMPLAPSATMFEAVCRSLLPKAIEFGITTEANIQRVFREIQQALDDGRYYSVLWPLMIGVWKRKPV
jgi:ubiquinone/menaquinone biosynthesis C-methylase UbiE